ncbi:imelysin family protein [Saccharospirillum mangrovi]|uniref:imelysin family protein n=1 Tax=Saccharospirillum mangrovi TaxID=2161747 RepID=UPI000D3DBFCE|nr:imelysin family protein [Saccharospirillum mangrovi]
MPTINVSHLRNGTLVMALAMVISACSDPEPEPIDLDSLLSSETEEVEEVEKGPGFTAAAELVRSTAQRQGAAILQACDNLNAGVTDFLAQPNETTRGLAQTAWHNCYEQWNRFRPFHQRAFTLTEQTEFRRLQSLINVRPYQPGYIDGLPDYPYSGLIHESGLDLTLEHLVEQHQMMDAESPSLGFPVVENFLWREPLVESWLPVAGADAAVVERRHRYLRLATDHLMGQLQIAVNRWQDDAGFSLLTEDGQMRLTWQSLQRLAQVELLSYSFADGTLDESSWHHLSAEAGQGRRHVLARLDGITALLQASEDEAGPLSSWLDRAETDVTSAMLREHLQTARAAVAALPENYTFGDIDPTQWQNTRQVVAQVAVDFNTISRQLGVTLITE